MVFVNRIGDMLHADVHHSGGAPNKNIGDAFLFVWKLQVSVCRVVFVVVDCVSCECLLGVRCVVHAYVCACVDVVFHCD
jgi:hypothetical protein